MQGQPHQAPATDAILDQMQRACAEGRLTPRIRDILVEFYNTHRAVAAGLGIPADREHALWVQFANLVAGAHESPPAFLPFSPRVREPEDLATFSEHFWHAAVDWERSSLRGRDNVDEISACCDRGENVILIGNHQTEPDPHLLSLLLAESYPRISSEIIFLAGHRVLVDPVAIPFAMGCNLICVYSKRHIDHPRERRAEKRHHNQRAIVKLRDLLEDGGKCVFVAPSGGRDRIDDSGELGVAPFDPESIELFVRVTAQTTTPTHFFPLALATHGVFPPPPTVEVEVGERRSVGGGPVHASFGSRLDPGRYPGSENDDRPQRMRARARYFHRVVSQLYDEIFA